MREVCFHSYANYGDNFWHLNYLRRLAEKYPDIRFTHCPKPELLGQLGEVTADLPNIELRSVVDRLPGSIDAWIGAESYIWSQPGANTEHIPFMMGWFQHLSKKIGLESPITEPVHLLLNYPALLRRTGLSKRYDFLIINAAPTSGQFRDYSEAKMTAFVDKLHQRHKVIATGKCDVPGLLTAQDHNLSLTDIGSISLLCDRIVGVATGPIWPTFNIWNHHRCPNRIMMLDREYLRHDEHCQHARSIGEAEDMLKEANLL